MTSAPAGLDCPGKCTADFPLGTEVLVSAQTEPTTRFIGMDYSVKTSTGATEFWNFCSPTGSIAAGDWDREKCLFTVTGDIVVKVDYWRKPQPGTAGVSINNGDIFTNDPRVELSVIWPHIGLGSMTISNDGGFAKSTKLEVQYKVPWTLQSSGPERLPKTVYLFFDNGSTRFTDDIILDETPPTLVDVSVPYEGAGVSLLRSMARASRKRSVTVVTRARDRTSGVSAIQIGPRKSGKLKKMKYRSRITVSTASRKLWVRVFDRAGNPSKWKSVRLG